MTFAASGARGATVSLVAVARNGSPLGGGPTNSVELRPGDTVTAEFQLSGWDGFPLGGYQFALRGKEAVVSGESGKMLPLGWDAPLHPATCLNDDMCAPPYPVCPGGGCVGLSHNPSLGAFIEESLPLFVFSMEGSLCAVDDGTVSLRYFCLSESTVGTVDPGSPRYGGTLILRATPDACGMFTFAMDPMETFVFSTDSPPITEALLTESLTLTVTDCAPRQVGCGPGDCWVDARIAHPVGSLLPRYNLDSVVFRFDRPLESPTVEDFAVSVEGSGCGFVPEVSELTTVGNDVEVGLTRKIDAACWTSVRMTNGMGLCRVASLPGDADGNLRIEESDVREVVDNLGGLVVPSLGEEKCDIDRSGNCAPADILVIADLVAEALACGAPFCEDTTLPTCPSGAP